MKNWKKLLTGSLAAALVLTTVPVTALAEEESMGQEEVIEVAEVEDVEVVDEIPGEEVFGEELPDVIEADEETAEADDTTDTLSDEFIEDEELEVVTENTVDELQDLAIGSGSSQYATAPQIYVGGTYGVDLTDFAPRKYFKFVPAQNGVYEFRSVSSGDNDPYARILLADGTIIQDDDDSAENYYSVVNDLDFALRVLLTANQVYYFQAGTYSTTARYSFTVTQLSGLSEDQINGYRPSSYSLTVWHESNRSIDVCPGGTFTVSAGWSTSGNVAPTIYWSVYREDIKILDNVVGGSTLTYTTRPDDTEADYKVEFTAKIGDESDRETFYVTSKKSAHNPGNWKVITPATALSPGVEARKCQYCGNVVESRPIAKLTPFINLNFSGTLPLKVKQSTTKVKVSLQTGDYITSWKSSKPKVVSVNKKGKLTAKKKGSAKITITTASGLKKTFTVKVQNGEVKAKSVKVASKKVRLSKKKKFSLAPTVTPITTLQKLSFTSSNKKVATVNKKGVITAKAKGKATITGRVGSKKVKITVQVK